MRENESLEARLASAENAIGEVIQLAGSWKAEGDGQLDRMATAEALLSTLRDWMG